MTRDQIIQWAREAGLSEVSATDPQCWIGSLAFPDAASIEAFAALVAAHEREEAAKVCERHADPSAGIMGAAIRARGKA